MIGQVPKGQWPAVTPTERVGGLRLRIYLHYDTDVKLQALLSALYARWWEPYGAAFRRLTDCLPDQPDGIDALGAVVDRAAALAYLLELRDLARIVGLDRIPAVGSGLVEVGYLPSGLAQTHRYLWRLDKALLWERSPFHSTAGHGVERPSFTRLASFGSRIPAVDTAIAGTDASWDPRTETRAAARKRLRQHTPLTAEAIEVELDRISRAGDYAFPDTSTRRSGIYRLDRDALWAWWRIRHRWPYARIAAEWEQLHPGDIQLQPQQDPSAQAWERENPMGAGGLRHAGDATSQVRKAVTVFAHRAELNIRTGPGRIRVSSGQPT